MDLEQLEDHVENLTYHNGEDSFPIELRNGITLKLQTKNKIIHFQNYRIKNNAEEYYRERLMLYISWKKESDILGNFHTYEDAFNTKRPEIIQKLAIYEPMSSILESALEEFEKDTCYELCVAPSAQHDNNDDAYVDKTTAHELAFHESDKASGQHLVDIGPLLRIVPVHIDDDNIELIPDIMTDNECYDLLCKLNRKQQEFHMHIMQQSQQNISTKFCVHYMVELELVNQLLFMLSIKGCIIYLKNQDKITQFNTFYLLHLLVKLLQIFMVQLYIKHFSYLLTRS